MKDYKECKKLIKDHFENYGVNSITIVTDNGKFKVNREDYVGRHIDDGSMFIMYPVPGMEHYSTKFIFNELKYISLHD